MSESYILDDSGMEMAFLQNVNGVYQPIQAVKGVIRSSVLPGFQFRVDDLYRRPKLISLALDPVYQAFMLPEYQAERQAKELAQQRLLDTVRNLLALMDDQTISRVTGLDIKVVRRLREDSEESIIAHNLV